MSSYSKLLLMFSLVLGVSLTAQTNQPADLVQSAQTAVERLEKAEYSAVVVMFSARLREKLPEPKVRETWEALHRRAGRLQRTGEPRTTTKDNLRRVIIPAQFERSKMEIEVVFNNDGEIAGLLLHRK